ncbi:PREDICTED: high-affinity choline transporter 1-like [Priapulus caudatus]|uniref:High-affinity choline transporter 1-like n=1 Tax=Priapulus caudatus TaxID=37621 RepID=A0ABM1EXW5_PRICU|nr:PREDICTED: high-affinity choline transporter 1-like [Priapulus caudatus]
MAVNISGIISVIVFYLLILAVGLWAGRKTKKATTGGTSESDAQLLAGRNIGLFVGSFTMTELNQVFPAQAQDTDGIGENQRHVGGLQASITLKYRLKRSETIKRQGFAYIAFRYGNTGGLFFAKKMHSAGYVTMLDPLCIKYGRIMAGLLFIPALLGELFWSAAILKALGATLAVILSLDQRVSVIISACIAIFYTFFGGLYSVAYTDVVQLICMFIGLVCGTLWRHSASIAVTAANPATSWYGTLEWKWAGVWVDYALHLIFGGIPWQASQPCTSNALRGSRTANTGDAAVIIDWNATSYPGEIPIPDADKSLILPIVMQYLTPAWVSFFGLGAVSAAVMSSADSSCLSVASLFANNIVSVIWVAITKRDLPAVGLVWTVRGGIVAAGVLAMAIGLSVDSIYGLFHLCSDLVYVMLFPQLVAALYIPFSNTYGSILGYAVGLFLRLGGGEDLINLKPIIFYPHYNTEDGQLFPFHTLSMGAGMIALVLGSLLAHVIFTRGILPADYDVLGCYQKADTLAYYKEEKLQMGYVSNGLLTTDDRPVGDAGDTKE